jgi:hypothetical protein
VNNGNTDVQLSNFSLSHPGMLSFQSGGSNVTLPPGETNGLDINFFTTVPDSIHGWLTFNTDVPGQNFVTVPIFANDPVFNFVPELTQESISVFPDPAHDFCTINLPDNFSEGNISIFDFTGKEMSLQEKKINQNTMEINLKNYSTGIYFVIYENKINGNIFRKKLLKY